MMFAPITQSRLGVIENQVRFLQLELWNSRTRLWTQDVPQHPLEVLNPGIALALKGFQIQTVDSLGSMSAHGRRSEIAGDIDRASRLVRVSRQFAKPIQFFTAAHELGHAVLHPNGSTMHRDIPPLTETCSSKEPEEREADWFATCFLMPEKYVRSWFRNSFDCEQFVLSDDTAFALATKSIDAVMREIRSTRDLSLMLARAISYGGRQIQQLSRVFSVSDTAMAIRLEQLDLVADPDRS